MVTHHVETVCPICGESLGASVHTTSGNGPQPGDSTLCAYCLTLLRFDETLAMRRLTRAEWAALTLEEKTKIVKLRRSLTSKHLSVVDWRHG